MCAEKGDAEGERNSKIFVGSLTKNAKVQELKQYFSRYGKLLSFKIVENRGNSSHNAGYGFAVFDKEESALSCLQD